MSNQLVDFTAYAVMSNTAKLNYRTYVCNRLLAVNPNAGQLYRMPRSPMVTTLFSTKTSYETIMAQVRGEKKGEQLTLDGVGVSHGK